MKYKQSLRTLLVSTFGVYTSLAFILSYLESLLPTLLPVQGVKLGLANIIIVFILYRYGMKYAILLSFVRVILTAFTFGNLSMMFYSLAGTIASILIMTLCKKTDKFSILGVSAAGGVFHNIGQILFAAFVISNARIIYYLPILIIAGILTGLLFGFASHCVLTRLPNNPVQLNNMN